MLSCMMNNSNKSQVLVLSLLLVLLSMTPLLSSSLRPTYLYFLFNLLIISLGAEAGLLSSVSKPSQDHDKKQQYCDYLKYSSSIPQELPSANTVLKNLDPPCRPDIQRDEEKDSKALEKPAAENMGKVEIKVTKGGSEPSLFFIANGDTQFAEEDIGEEEEGKEQEEEEGEEESNGGISGQELFAKAETFIGNFYKQLQMQREDSWKRINHGFPQKAF